MNTQWVGAGVGYNQKREKTNSCASKTKAVSLSFVACSILNTIGTTESVFQAIFGSTVFQKLPQPEKQGLCPQMTHPPFI